MIFTRTKRTAQKVADELAERGFKVGAVHGDLGQVAREKALKAFRTGEIDVLVATDVAARGIDIDDVTHVINYQCPDDEKTYVHRIGRTGRAGHDRHRGHPRRLGRTGPLVDDRQGARPGLPRSRPRRTPARRTCTPSSTSPPTPRHAGLGHAGAAKRASGRARRIAQAGSRAAATGRVNAPAAASRPTGHVEPADRRERRRPSTDVGADDAAPAAGAARAVARTKTVSGQRQRERSDRRQPWSNPNAAPVADVLAAVGDRRRHDRGRRGADLVDQRRARDDRAGPRRHPVPNADPGPRGAGVAAAAVDRTPAPRPACRWWWPAPWSPATGAKWSAATRRRALSAVELRP